MIGGKKVVALCATRISDSTVHSFVKLLSRQLQSHNIGLLIFTLNTDLYWEEDVYHSEASVFNIIPYDLIDALLYMDERVKCRRIGESIIAKAKEHNIPVLVLDGQYENTISVSFDYAAGFEKIVRHVIEDHGVRRPHMMAGLRNNKFSDDRIAVFRKVIEEYGIRYSDSMVSYGDFWAVPTRVATRKLLKCREELPDAIICANDIMAINVCDVLMDAGISVPEQIIVTGFDGVEETNYSVPRISTVNCSTAIFAKTVANYVIDHIDKEPEYRTWNIAVIPELELKESCGCIHVKNQDLSNVATLNDRFYRYFDDVRVLYGITARMQLCKHVNELSGMLHKYVLNDTFDMHDFSVVLYKYCLDRSHNIFDEEGLVPDYDKRVVICDHTSKEAYTRDLEDGELLPGLEKLVATGQPLIFNALDTLDKPLGYVCYCFDSFNIIDYSKTALITNSITTGVCNFINMHYQRYLSEKVDEMFKYDLLTGLYNRTGFMRAFEGEKGDVFREKGCMTVIMADIDDLKIINDSYGHETGDKAIAAVASALKEASPDDALCMRFGGDEMLIIIPGKCDAKLIVEKAEKIIDNVNMTSENSYKLSVSCGYCEVNLTGELDYDAIVHLADEKMYSVKRKKKENKKE